MDVMFAALLHRPDEIPDCALSQGFAVALAGWDVPAPSLAIAELAGIPGWAAAFYTSGAKVEDFDLACDLFEEELSPALAVLDAAAELGREGARVYAVTYADGVFHDDAWRFDANGYERHYVREGDDGVEAGVETPEGAKEMPVAGDDDVAALERSARAHRGTTFLSQELGAPVLPALVHGLWATERRVPVRLADPSPDAIDAETKRLDRALSREPGRGAFEPPAFAGRPVPDAVRAFVRAYDWADPKDPDDLYRGLSIGAIEGTLRFLRPADLAKVEAEPAFAKGLYPIARLPGSALGGGGPGATLALAADGDHLVIVRPGQAPREAGPTFGELVRYLALGWSKRSDAEEDMIGALMLRARIRCEGVGG